MSKEEIKRRRLENQHLLQKADTRTVVRDLCGVQAQFLSHALHGLSLRADADTSHLVKSWTLRGTLHLFDEEDLPLFLHEGRTRFLRPQDTMDTDAWIGKEKKSYFSHVILDAIGSGRESRDELKCICREKGMTESEETSLFDPWGGIIRALCEQGRICHRVSQEKAYCLCPEFTPMDRDTAKLELVRRYFTHFGPATVKDAAYFLGWTQREVRQQLSLLDTASFQLGDETFYHIPRAVPDCNFPSVLFLAGFDQLMLGYEKTQSLFLPPEHLRDIFTRSGIVRPALLVNGTVAGHWNLKNGKLIITLFRIEDTAMVKREALTLWPQLKKIEIL